jgi:hypothetical protein
LFGDPGQIFYYDRINFFPSSTNPPSKLILINLLFLRTRDDYIGEVKLNLPDFKVGENDEAELDEWFPLKAAQLEEKDGPDPEQEMIQEVSYIRTNIIKIMLCNDEKFFRGRSATKKTLS